MAKIKPKKVTKKTATPAMMAKKSMGKGKC